MKKLLIAISILALASVSASAQGALLKKLGQNAIGAAEKKVEKKVEKTVGDKVGSILGVDVTAPNAAEASAQSTATNHATSTGIYASNYAESLFDGSSDSGIYAPGVEKSSLSFRNYREALAARPAWPSLGDLSSRAALTDYAAAYEDYMVAVRTLCDACMARQTALSEQSMGSGSDNRCDEISQELSDIYQKELEGAFSQLTSGISSVQSVLLGGRTAADENTLAGALSKQRDRSVRAWKASEECRKVNMLEAKSSGAESRKAQNAVIDSWNATQLSQWVAILQRFDSRDSAAALRVAELDAELNSMGSGVRSTSSWAGAKAMAATLNGLILSYAGMPVRVLDCPLVRNVWED